MQASPVSRLEQLRTLAAEEALPCAVVDLDAFDRNLERLAAAVAGTSLTVRVASKSVRVPALLRRVLEAGSPFAGLMCYSAREAEALAGEGFDDLLVAYPTLHEQDLAALRRLHERGTAVRMVVDGVTGARLVDAAMEGVATPFPVLVDVDASLRPLGGRVHVGVLRSPLHDATSVAALVRELEGLSHVAVLGAMCYEAQVAGLPDANPFRRLRNPVVRPLRRWSARDVARRRREVRAALEAAGVEVEVFNGGGTGSLAWAVREHATLSEVTAGSGLLCPHLFDYYAGTPFEPACWYAVQVSRVPRAGVVTCHCGGYVASGEAGRDRLPVVAWPPGAQLVAAEGAGEVQTPVRLPRGVQVGVGEALLMRHAKAGELAEHVSTYLLVAGNEVVERVPSYRGMGWSFG